MHVAWEKGYKQVKVLFLLLNGRESGTRFLNQSESNVKKNMDNYQHSIKETHLESSFQLSVESNNLLCDSQ